MEQVAQRSSKEISKAGYQLYAKMNLGTWPRI